MYFKHTGKVCKITENNSHTNALTFNNENSLKLEFTILPLEMVEQFHD